MLVAVPASTTSHPRCQSQWESVAPPDVTQASGTSSNAVGTDSEGGALTTAKKPAGRRAKTFNMNTYKAHALGDYAKTIRRYGTTDSYSTEPVSSLQGVH